VTATILEVRDLTVAIHGIHAVDGVSFTLAAGRS